MGGDNQSDSHESSSTSTVEDSVNISFEDLTYTVRHSILHRGRKTILNGLSGSLKAGELTVIMGQSGAGKSTLMDILAGYTNETSGNILVNGHVRDLALFRRRSCYIMQDDMVQDKLTVHESLAIAAQLKLGDHISTEQKRRRVQELMTSLGLSRLRETRTGHLSGGQKKRLAIALELVSDPPVMFMDEPTSGLDSSISKQIVYLLHLLARQGRTVVVTMHQPSTKLLEMVDRLYAVSGGKCTYMGSVPQLIPYLAKMKLICPKFHDSVDFFIEITAENANQLVECSGNGKNTEWITDETEETDSKVIEKKFISKNCEDVCLTVLPTQNEDSTRKILLKLKNTYSTSFWRQFSTLTRRSLLRIWRDPQSTLMMTGIHCSMAVFVGFLFYDIGGNAKYVRDNYSFLYFSLMFLMFTAFNSVSITFPEQIPVVRREHFNRWYMTGAYFTSTFVSAIPTQTLCTLTYSIITYWMTGQPPETLRFFGYCWILTLISYVALCIGLFNGSMCTVKYGVVFGPLLLMPFTIFSGFFLRLADAPWIFRWIFHVSFLKHGLVGLVLTIFGMDRPKLPCPKLFCVYVYPKQFLIDIGMFNDSYLIVNLALFAIACAVTLCSFIILKIRLRSKW